MREYERQDLAVRTLYRQQLDEIMRQKTEQKRLDKASEEREKQAYM